MHLGVKYQFSRILNFFFILWFNLVDTIGFFDVVDIDKLLVLLAHLSRRLIGELIVYKGIRRPSVRRPSVRPSTFSNDISSEAEKPILFIFHI